MPSGPGAESGAICYMAEWTSSAMKFQVRLKFISSVTLGIIPSKIASIPVGLEVVNRLEK